MEFELRFEVDSYGIRDFSTSYTVVLTEFELRFKVDSYALVPMRSEI
jgi:hypothetical protein